MMQFIFFLFMIYLQNYCVSSYADKICAKLNVPH